MTTPLGLSGRIAAYFQTAQITPLLALCALLLGVFAVIVTPREEEPQIDVTMANVLIAFPGAAVKDVESMVATPAEQVLTQIAGVEHVMAVSRTGMAILTVQFKVGVPRTEALVRLHDSLSSHRDWLPINLGVQEPIIKPKGIDDVPIVALTLWSKDPAVDAFSLTRVAHSVESDLKRVAGTREVMTIGGSSHAIRIDIDPTRLAGSGLSILELQRVVQSANHGAPLGELVAGNRTVAIEAGPFFQTSRDVADVIVGVHEGHPIRLGDVAQVRDGAAPITQNVWHTVAGKDGGMYPAVTLSITKQSGQNAVRVADAVLARAHELNNTIIPHGVEMTVTRNYGATASDKAQKLIQKLLFATASVVALVFLTLGAREAAIVGLAVGLTLTVTLFASWAWGFTLNRVSLFALIFSIGILVDDAIVVVENIHRHRLLYPEKTLIDIIPRAVDEVGGPTILATLTVIAALLPMAFVSGLMGPYMGPIPINASMGMLLSLAIAFTVTPWLARLWIKDHVTAHAGIAQKMAPLFWRVFTPLLGDGKARRNRIKVGFVILALIGLSILLPVIGWVQLKMLPFDNKSEFQVMVDMPVGTPLEETTAVLSEISHYLTTVPEVTNVQSYAGTASPINFNGLVRQYYLRTGGEVGDLQVNLVDKHHRDAKSHAIAMRVRPALQDIGRRYQANVKVVEVPPGPPVLAPVVAEIYGPTEAGRAHVAQTIRATFESTSGMVDVDDSRIAVAPRKLLMVDQSKAAQLGVSQEAIVATLRTGLQGEAATYLHDASKYPTPALVRLSDSGDISALLQLRVRNLQGKLIPIQELVTTIDAEREQPRYRKDGLPVIFVVGDMAGKVDSPLYGMFSMRSAIAAMTPPGGGTLDEFFVQMPSDPYRQFALKWDGEWQITYETFRDMGIAYMVGLVLIYLLVVAQFGSYLTPLIIMAPIPLTIIGVIPGHALLGAQFTATSMIGMIALAGIIVRNSILLVDFIRLQIAQGVPFEEAIVTSAIARAQPIGLTALAAMLGAFFILDDPIFNGLAISLIFGILVSTLLTLVVIPLLYYIAYRNTSQERNIS